MITISKLQGEVNAAGEFDKSSSTPMHALHEEPNCPGFMIQICLGHGGIRLRSPGAEVGIPMEAILELVRAKVPELFPTPAHIDRAAERKLERLKFARPGVKPAATE